jgi:hypothetical protein
VLKLEKHVMNKERKTGNIGEFELTRINKTV